VTRRLKVMSSTAQVPRRRRRAVIAVGVFDGVHIGHRRILEEAKLLAAGLGTSSMVVTFEPHPASVLLPREAPGMLTSLEERVSLIRSSGIDETLVLAFTPKLARQRAEWFVRSILLGKLNLTRLVIGYDFRFGRGREGDARYLEALGAKMGFGVDIVPAVIYRGRPVSSTRIREALARGDVGSARRMLGRAYSVAGKVVRGEGRARGLGYPTANLAMKDPGKVLPDDGVYAAWAVVGGVARPGVLYLGTRPTYGGGARGVEVHLLGAADAGGRLYGRAMEAQFVERLRGERFFKNEAELRRAVTADVGRAWEVLSN
jgi:riboflavin kinase/FMN adenylyltransferase